MHLAHFLRWAAPTIMFVAGLTLLSLDPLQSPYATIGGYVLFVALVVWMYLRLRNSADEVVRAANVAAMAIGAPIGIAIAFSCIFVMRFTPAATRAVTQLADASSQAMGPAAAGFGLGILFTCCVVLLCALAAWAGWWVAKR